VAAKGRARAFADFEAGRGCSLARRIGKGRDPDWIVGIELRPDAFEAALAIDDLEHVEVTLYGSGGQRIAGDDVVMGSRSRELLSGRAVVTDDHTLWFLGACVVRAGETEWSLVAEDSKAIAHERHSMLTGGFWTRLIVGGLCAIALASLLSVVLTRPLRTLREQLEALTADPARRPSRSARSSGRSARSPTARTCSR